MARMRNTSYGPMPVILRSMFQMQRKKFLLDLENIKSEVSTQQQTKATHSRTNGKQTNNNNKNRYKEYL